MRNDSGAMQTKKYDGFISYSTQADGDLAPKIQDGLEQLAKPWNRRRALKIFQDIDDLAATPNLSDTLRAELVGSQTLVFLASPAAAASPWCNDELSYWIDTRPAHELIVVLTAGTLDFDKDADFPTRFETSTAAPPAFARMTSIPLYVDMRYTDDEVRRIDVRTDPEFRAKLTKISAALHSNKSGRAVEPRDIDSMDLAEHRKAQRFRRAAVASLSMLTVVALIAALVAVVQRRTAIEQRDTANSQALAIRSELELERDPQQAGLLALQALDASDTPEARRAMFASASSRWVTTLPATALTAVFSHDGTSVLTSGNGETQLWSTDGSLVADFPTGFGAVAVDDDGDRIVVSGDEQLGLWDGAGTLLAAFGDGFASAAAFDRSGTRLATAGLSGTRLWDVPALERGEPGLLSELETENVNALAFSSDGSRLALGGDGAAYVYAIDGESPDELASLPHIENVRAVQFGGDNSTVVTADQFQGEGGGPAEVHVWDLTTSLDVEVSRQTLVDGDVSDPSISADGRWLITSNVDGTASVSSTMPGSGLDGADCPDTPYELVDIVTLARHNGATFSAGFDGDGSRAVTVGLDGVRIWNLTGLGRTLPPDAAGALLPLSGTGFSDAVIGPGGSVVLASGQTNVLWDLQNGTETRLDDFCPGPQIGAFSPTGERMIIGEADDGLAGILSERDLLGNEVQRVSVGMESVRAVSYGADGTLLTVGSDGLTRWDQSWNPIAQLSERSARAAAMFTGALDSDTRVVVVDDDDPDTPRILDGSGVEVASLEGHDDWVNAAAFSPDGRLVATASNDRTARIWDLEGNLQAVLAGHDLGVLDVAFGPGPIERRIVTASDDTTVRIWDADGREIGVFDDHPRAANSASFSADGAWIVAAGADATVRIWRVPSDVEILARVKALAGQR